MVSYERGTPVPEVHAPVSGGRSYFRSMLLFPAGAPISGGRGCAASRRVRPPSRPLIALCAAAPAQTRNFQDIYICIYIYIFIDLHIYIYIERGVFWAGSRPLIAPCAAAPAQTRPFLSIGEKPCFQVTDCGQQRTVVVPGK